LLPPDVPGGVCTPVQASLDLILRKWLDFRYTTVRRRFEYELQKLRDRIHILEGFAVIFADLDTAIRIIRASQGKRDAAERLMDHFDLDDVQVEKILELQLYRLARLPITEILEELEEKREEAARIEAILASQQELWSVVRSELLDIRSMYGRPRRTKIGGDATVTEFDESAYIIAEDAFVVVTREGWVKRQASFTSIDRIRTREGDEVGWFLLAGTRASITFFSNLGGAYVMRVDDVPATTGYGEPIQKHFRFSNGERLVGVSTSDPRGRPSVIELDDSIEAGEAPPHGVALTRSGRIIRFSLSAHTEVSQRGGRRYARVSKGDQVLRVLPSDGTEWASIATVGGNALAFAVNEVTVLKGAGKGVTGIKLKSGDSVLAFELVSEPRDGVKVQTTRGRDVLVSPKKYGGSRAGRGQSVIQRGGFQDWAPAMERLDLQFGSGEE
jgi:DNA gyrase subunit A